MFDLFLIPVLERLHGKKLATLMGEQSGSAVSERTVRNWMNGITAPRPVQVKRIKDRVEIAFHGKLLQRKWPTIEADKYLADMSASKGIVSAFIYSVSAENGYQYENTHALAQKIDEISFEFAELRRQDYLTKFAELLLNSDLIDLEHLVDPEKPDSAEAMRQKIVAAQSWDDFVRPFAVITLNLYMQLLATLDLEFCSKYLVAFRPRSVFSLLMPRIDPSATLGEDGRYAVKRNMFHLPVQRLLDLSACLCYLRVHRKWPEEIPSVIEMAAWMKSEPTTLTKWRTGRRFSLRNYENLWSAMFDGCSEKNQPATPVPLAFAAAFLTQLCVKGSRETKDLSIHVPNPAIYLRWWEIQRARLESQHGAFAFGERAWSPLLT